MILALDTAARTAASLALFDGERIWAEETWRSDQQHTVELLPRIDRAVRAARLKPDALTGVAVALGPGSYTGLRVALSVAKGMALAGGLPVVGIPTLEIVAHPHRHQPLPVCAFVPAGRGRISWAFYGRVEGGWGRAGDVHLGSIAELAQTVAEATFFVGEMAGETRDALRAALGDKAHLATPALALRRAGVLAELGWARLSRGDVDDVATLSPLYLREP